MDIRNLYREKKTQFAKYGVNCRKLFRAAAFERDRLSSD